MGGGSSMKKILMVMVMLLIVFSFTGCSNSMYDGNGGVIKGYGWANSDTKWDNVAYQTSISAVAFSAIFIETTVIPIILTGWFLFEPVAMIEEDL